MPYLKKILVHAIGLVCGIFCAKWAVKIAADQMGFLDSLGGAQYLSQKLLVPTNLLGVVEALVTLVVFTLVVEAVSRSGLLK